MATGIPDLIHRLKMNPDVLGLVRYGSRTVYDNSRGGDFDIFVFVRDRDSDLESIHFYWGETPVDLSLRTLADLDREKPVSYIDSMLAAGELLYDRVGKLGERLATAVRKWRSISE